MHERVALLATTKPRAFSPIVEGELNGHRGDKREARRAPAGVEAAPTVGFVDETARFADGCVGARLRLSSESSAKKIEGISQGDGSEGSGTSTHERDVRLSRFAHLLRNRSHQRIVEKGIRAELCSNVRHI